MNKTPSLATLLIVDDQPSNLDVLFHVLDEAGYEVLVAKNGRRALETLKYRKPDLILLDIMMPEMDGFEACKRIKSQPELTSIPIIFMSALSDVTDKLKGFDHGGADYITKPIQHQELLARIETHLKLHRLQQELIASNRQLEVFSHTVAHDLKNPLNVVLVYAETLYEDYPVGSTLDEAAHQRLAKITRSSRQMFGLIEDLLLLAASSEQSAVKLEMVDLRPLVQRLLENQLYDLIRSTQAQIELLGEYWPPVYAYEPWLEAVCLNYLSNALKYGCKLGESPRIEIRTFSQAVDQIRFEVRDHGNGLSREQCEQAFMPFVRIHDPNHKIEGHGLGLSIVRNIITRLGGQCGVDCVQEQGCAFYFTLPEA